MSKRMLIAYSMAGAHVQTTREYLTALKTFSGYEVDYLHVTHDANITIDFDRYDILFHNYCARLCFDGYLSESYRKNVKQFRGLKIAAVQDEYERTNALKATLKDLAFDVLLTCVPQNSLEYVYPRAEFPSVEFITVLTGYVPDQVDSQPRVLKSLKERPIFIGYRGRDIGSRFGQLGFDKYEIGRRMKEVCDARGITTDIAMDEDSRIYGSAWYDFIGSCRAMLGSESGSNVFDFDGSLATKYNEMALADGGRAPSYSEFRQYIEARDREIDMGQISPRIFECAVMKTPMVLFRGLYSGAIEPDTHYVVLEKDFSNIDSVLEQLKDIHALEAMAARVHAHIVESGLFGYRKFVATLQEVCERKLQQKGWRASNLPTQASHGRPQADRRSEILKELPTSVPKSQREFVSKHEHLGMVSMLSMYKRSIPLYARQAEHWKNSIAAHAKVLDAIDSLTHAAKGGSRASSIDTLRRLRKNCDTLSAAENTYAEKVTSLPVSYQLLDDERCRALEVEQFHVAKVVAEAYGTFFENILRDVVELNRLAITKIGQLRYHIGMRGRLRLRARAIGALLEAPWRAFFIALVQMSPAIHDYAKRIRRMVHGD